MKTEKDIQQAVKSIDIQMAKQTRLGQKIMQEMKPIEIWVNDISPDGKIIGRLEMISGRYECCD